MSHCLVNSSSPFVCQHFMNITSQLSRDVFERVNGWVLQDCPELVKLSMRTLLERGHGRNTVRAQTHADVWDAGNPLVLRQTHVIPSLTLFLLHLTCLGDVRAAEQKHK